MLSMEFMCVDMIKVGVCSHMLVLHEKFEKSLEKRFEKFKNRSHDLFLM